MKKKKKISFLEFFDLILNNKDAFSKLANYFHFALWISGEFQEESLEFL